MTKIPTTTQPTKLGTKWSTFGLDSSLTGTGCAWQPATLAHPATSTVNPGKLLGLERIRFIREVVAIARAATTARCALVVIENPAFSRTSGSAHERGGLWWALVDDAEAAGAAVLKVPPTTLKKFATGSGAATKDAMVLAAARAFPSFDGDNNAADALWLYAYGCEWVGDPILDRTKVQLEALNGSKLL